MLISKPKIQIVSRVIQNRAGESFLAYFAVAEFNGEIFVQLLKSEPINTEEFVEEKGQYVLRGVCKICPEFQSIISPFRKFLNIRDFAFVTSQPTRAPNSTIF